MANLIMDKWFDFIQYWAELMSFKMGGCGEVDAKFCQEIDRAPTMSG
jgi:hypothetical protein